MQLVSSRLRGTAAIGLVAFALAACSGSAGASPTPLISPLANSEWSLSTIAGGAMPSGVTVTLNFAILQADGFGGCNQFFMPYTTADTGLSFGPIAGTRRLCGDPADAFETGYYSSLSSVTKWAITNDTLELSNAAGETVLTYARSAPATVDGPWNITQVNNGNQGVEPIPTGVSATISFLPDGTVEGFGGCNSFSGGYSLGDNNKIAIGPLMSSLVACGDPADTFEHQLLTALEMATQWSVANGNLELRDDSGALQVGASSAIGH